MTEPLITSLLDTDLYKFTMMQCIFHHYPETLVEYRFQIRKPIDLTAIKEALQDQTQQLCQLTLTEEELNYLKQLSFFKEDFIQFLRQFKLNNQSVEIFTENNLEIHIKGKWVETILFEVPLLAIVCEVYYQTYYPNTSLKEARKKLQEKIAYLKTHNQANFKFSDFGTRRRFSKNWQEELLHTFQNEAPTPFAGTSNIYFSKQLNLKPIGTMAHEYLQAFQRLAPALKGSQHLALEIWLKEYQGNLSIALTDTLTMDVFLQEFDYSLANQYWGLRQDSGDPFEWGKKALNHYQKLGIDAHEKIFVFSDSLTIPKAIAIYNYFKNDCSPTFGIGTNLTNDVGLEALDIVIKMTRTNGKPVVKISDSKGKVISTDNEYLNFVKKELNIKDK